MRIARLLPQLVPAAFFKASATPITSKPCGTISGLQRQTSAAAARPRLAVICAVVLASFSVGCGSSSDTLEEVSALKERVCACKDAACVAKLKSDSAGLNAKVAKLTGEDMDKALKIAVEMMKCASDLGVPQDGF